MIEAARGYLAAGLHVIPAEGKAPRVPWKEYQVEPPHADQIDEWFTRWPDTNLGFVLGRGLMVVDLDGAGAEGLLHNASIALPTEAPRVRTGNGQHVYLAVDEPIGDRIGLLTAPGGGKPQVDIRGVGFVVAPPSVHPETGRQYEWIVPFSRPVPKAPAALIRLIHAPKVAEPRHDDAPGWVAEALRGVGQGLRDATATKLAGYFIGKGLDRETTAAVLAQSFARNCVPPFPETDVWKCVRSIAGRHSVNGAGGDVAGREAIIVDASTISPETIEWLWPGRIAVGALTNCVGLPDQGKSLIFTDVVSRLTTGSPMPPAPSRPGLGAPQRVLILTLEDSLRYTLVPRLIKAGADLTRVDFVQKVRDAEGRTSLLTLADDLDALGHAFEAKPYVLMIIDGLTGYLGDVRSHNDADVRRVLTPFAELLDRSRVAGLGVMHPPKLLTNLAYYAGGSIAFTSVPRVTLGVAPDPEDESPSPRRLLMKLKGNLYGHVTTLAYRIVADGPADVPWLEWEPVPVDVDVRAVLDPEKESAEDRTARQDCARWLREYLADGPKPATEVQAAAMKAGFKKKTIERAKKKAGIDSAKAGSGAWYWDLAAGGEKP